MSDILSTSVSGLLAFQRALDVTSNNISNVATPGYSVENANFTPQPERLRSGPLSSRCLTVPMLRKSAVIGRNVRVSKDKRIQ